MLRKLIRSTMPTPLEYLTAFKGLPAHFRKSDLAELAKQHWNPMSDGLKPQIDADGVSLRSVRLDPVSMEIERKFKCHSFQSQHEDMAGDHGNELNADHHRDTVPNVRLFRLEWCSGVPLPDPSMAFRIVDRRVRVCLLANNSPISNVFTVPAEWKSTEEDQWTFGKNVWRESIAMSSSNAVSEWNSFCVALDIDKYQDVEDGAASKMNIELLLELCITVKPDKSAASEQQQGSQSINPNSSNMEMSCGWTKLEIHSSNNVSGIIKHSLKINGGSFQCESDINDSDVRSRRTSISGMLWKLKQKHIDGGIESTVRIQEQSYHSISNSNVDRTFMQWLPPHSITPLSSCKLVGMHYELMADHWLRIENRPSLQFEHHYHRQNLFQSIFLFIVDRPNLLCVLIDQWKAKKDSLSWSQRRNPQILKQQFKALLQQFVPLLIHHNVTADKQNNQDIGRDSLHPETISFVKRIVEGNVEHVLCGNKQSLSHSTPLIYAPFDTDLLVC